MSGFVARSVEFQTDYGGGYRTNTGQALAHGWALDVPTGQVFMSLPLTTDEVEEIQGVLARACRRVVFGLIDSGDGFSSEGA
jgi:hypothetical protein